MRIALLGYGKMGKMIERFPGQPVGWKDGMRWWLVAGNNKVDFSMPRISVSG